MTMYHAMFGLHPTAYSNVELLELTLDTDIPRFRDSWIVINEAGIPEIAILTRSGSGNREVYAEANAKLANHPSYLRDEDEPFDNTYALFYFAIPMNLHAAALDVITRAPAPPPLLERTAQLGEAKI